MRIISRFIIAWALLGANALHAADFEGNFRYRTEWVDDQAVPLDSAATTLRSRLSWSTQLDEKWRAVIEVDDIRALDRDRYYSAVYGPTTRPLVADPEGTDLNRLLIERKGKHVDLVLGRQAMLLDDQRFIGNVGWRQNEQTYDGVMLKWRALPKTEIIGAWIWKVNRIYGPKSGTQAATWHGNTYVLNARRDFGRFGAATVFAYRMAFDEAASASNETNGIAWRGQLALAEGWKVPWVLSYARQYDYGANATSYSAAYRRIELGVGKGVATLRAGQELLDGDAAERTGRRFQTPLATLHAFQGWADKFVATPAGGVDDRYLVLDVDLRGYKATAGFHDYRAAALSKRFGEEWNVSLSRKVTPRIEVLGKYADYSSQGFAADTTKTWLVITGKF